jgi:proteasome assembly chaperone (PAC2) family protein
LVLIYVRRFIDIDSASLKKPLAIIGLPGIANVGRIAVETLARLLDAEHVIDFYSSDFPPRVFVKDGITHFPKSSVHIYHAAPDEPHDVFILSADFQPTSTAGVFEYADFFVKEMVNSGVREVYALAAYEQGYEEFFSSYPAPSRVYVSASSEDLLKRVSAHEGAVTTKEGLINGANGFIPVWAATMYDMEGACLLGETLGIIKFDYRAAKRVLEIMTDLAGLTLDFAIIDDNVSQVVQFIEWARSEIAQKGPYFQGAESPDFKGSDRYIG